MRPTLQYIETKFDYYNNLCFGGKLRRPPIYLSTRYATMGLTKGIRKTGRDGSPEWTNLTIGISIRRDLPEEEYIDTLVHEMIHYYIMSNNLKDDSVHGSIFRKIMKEITDKYGIKVTIEFSMTEEEMVNSRTRYRYICVAEHQDGRMFVAVVARNKVFEFWDLIPAMEGIEKVWWYVSDRVIFEQFPVAVSPTLHFIDASKLNHYLTGAKELENDGKVIRVVEDHSYHA